MGRRGVGTTCRFKSPMVSSFRFSAPADLAGVARPAHARRLLVRCSEVAPHSLEEVIAAWDAGAKDHTVYVGSLVRSIYQAADPIVAGRAWVEDLARTLRYSGSKLRVVW